jgi:hypothetical protein
LKDNFFYDNILLALDKKQITSITFTDISKAFDTVWIKALILKLENYDIKGKLLFWLKSYLSRRKQRVVIKDAISSTGELKAGVPQGSVLGAIYMTMHLNIVNLYLLMYVNFLHYVPYGQYKCHQQIVCQSQSYCLLR